MNRREFLKQSGLLGIGLNVVSGCALVTRQREPSRRPNIIFFLADDLGYDDLGCYGGTRIRTPHIDRLAQEGVRLTDFYVTHPVCTPSRASLLTGRYPFRNGMYYNIGNPKDFWRHLPVEKRRPLPPDRYAVSPEMTRGLDVREITVGDMLHRAGYRNGIFGKWDLGRARRFLPLQRGFDDYYGFGNNGIDYYTHKRYGTHSMFRNNQPDTTDVGTYATYLFQREALRFIHENNDRPLFLYVPFNAPHIGSSLKQPGVQAPDKYIAMYGDLPGTKSMAYNAAVTFMDDAIGEILDLLDHYELTDNTVVFFSSDNGSGSSRNGPLRGRKGQFWEGGIRMPCIVRWPGKIPAGTVCDEFLTMLEFFPTALDLVGVSSPKDVVLDGFDMMPVLKGEAPSRRNVMFWWSISGPRAARMGHWKWVKEKDEEGLYDLSADIGETNNLRDKHPAKYRELCAAWDGWWEEMEASEPRGPYRNY